MQINVGDSVVVLNSYSDTGREILIGKIGEIVEDITYEDMVLVKFDFENLDCLHTADGRFNTRCARWILRDELEKVFVAYDPAILEAILRV